MVRLRPGDAARVLSGARLFDHRPDPKAARAYLADPGNVFLLAYDGTTPVGFLRGTALRQVETRRLQMFLYEIAVARPYRRRGVGRALVERLLGDCRRRGFDEVFVFTSPGNRAAVGLYVATGGRTETAADRMYVYPLRPRRSPRS